MLPPRPSQKLPQHSKATLIIWRQTLGTELNIIPLLVLQKLVGIPIIKPLLKILELTYIQHSRPKLAMLISVIPLKPYSKRSFLNGRRPTTQLVKLMLMILHADKPSKSKKMRRKLVHWPPQITTPQWQQLKEQPINQEELKKLLL